MVARHRFSWGVAEQWSPKSQINNATSFWCVCCSFQLFNFSFMHNYPILVRFFPQTVFSSLKHREGCIASLAAHGSHQSVSTL